MADEQKPEVLTVNLWRGDSVQIVRDGEIVCQGRSFGDVLKALSAFFGCEITTKE